MKLKYSQEWMQILRSFALFLLTLDIYHYDAVTGATNHEDVERHLEMGKRLLAAGQLVDALSHYHSAVDADRNNYLTYFKRATVFLAMGKSRSALPDLNKAIELRPNFISALIHRGNIFIKQGNLKQAESDFKAVGWHTWRMCGCYDCQKKLSLDSGNIEAMEKLDSVKPLQMLIEQAQFQFDDEDYEGVVETLTSVVEQCPLAVEIREMRVNAYVALGELGKAARDLRQTVKLTPDNTKGYLRLSALHYSMGEEEDSLLHIRECLRLDPDHKECFTLYKKVKKLAKHFQAAYEARTSSQYEDCIRKADQILNTESKVAAFNLRAHSLHCHCFSKVGDIVQALDACSRILESDSENVDALVDRAETHILNEDFDMAIADYRRAAEIDPDSKRIQDGLSKAQKLLKQANKKDYYKILGVRRTAKKRDIVKAYRKLAGVWHPDKFELEREKAAAHRKFMELAAAKEVLTDPEKRKQFDNGEDPLDPETQQHSHGGHPFFHQGFNPFGSSGFSFKFNFN